MFVYTQNGSMQKNKIQGGQMIVKVCMCAPKVHQFKKEIPKVDKKYRNYVYAQNESMQKKGRPKMCKWIWFIIVRMKTKMNE